MRKMRMYINFVNIFKAIKKGLKAEDGEEVEQKQLKVSDVLR